MKARAAVRQYNADRPVNLGDSVDVKGNEQPRQLIRASFEDSRMLSLMVQCTDIFVPQQQLTLADYRAMVRVQWGNGGATVQADFDVTYRRSVPFACSYIDVAAWICPLPFPGTNVPIGPQLLDGPSTRPGNLHQGVNAHFRGSIAEGQQIDEIPGTWLTQFGAVAGQFVIGQCRIMATRQWAYSQSDGAPPLYMLYFDKATMPVNGDIPDDGTPLKLNNREDVNMGASTRSWIFGFTWALSTTSDKLTLPPAGNLAFITTEIRT